MFIFDLILILFLVIVTILFIALVLVRMIMWKVKHTVGKAFTSKERFYYEGKDTINTNYQRKKTISVNDADYVDFEEIKE